MQYATTAAIAKPISNRAPAAAAAGANAAKMPDPTGKGYGTDPDVLTPHKPGDFWPLTFNAEQKKAYDLYAGAFAGNLGLSVGAVVADLSK